MASELAADELVPFRWPAGWTDPGMVERFEGGPINCLVIEGSTGPIAEAAQKSGLAVREQTAPGVVTLSGLVWPRIKPLFSAGRDQVEAGPTGAPWIDSNGWVARLAAMRAPGKPVWLDFAPPPDLAPGAAAYRLAIADAAAAGARWMISLDDALSRALAAGDPAAAKDWRGILAAAAFFEKHQSWRQYRADGPLGIVSTFAGENKFFGTELLNLAARRNLLDRIIDRSDLQQANFSGLRALLWADKDRPPADQAAKLSAFAEGGGVLIVPRQIVPVFKAGRAMDCAVAGYEMRALGKGSLAAATREWDDPFRVAVEAQSLVSRRYDPFRLLNGASEPDALFGGAGRPDQPGPTGEFRQPAAPPIL